MARYASLADYYAAHRRAFSAALELGCTPREAERRLMRQDSDARIAEIRRRRAAAEQTPSSTSQHSERPMQWWERD